MVSAFQIRTMGVVLLLLAGNVHAQQPPAPLSTQQREAELREATALMQKFARETSQEKLRTMTRELIAPREVCQKVFAPALAEKLATEYVKWWEDGNFILGGTPGQTEVRLTAVTTDELTTWTGAAAKNLAGGWRRIAKHVRPGYTLYNIQFVKPGEELGMRFDGLTKVDGKWYIFPKAWRMAPVEPESPGEKP